MLRNTFFAVLTVAVAAATSQAAFVLEKTSIDTPGLAGFKTWTVSARSDDPISAVNFAGAGDNNPDTGLGFFGTMNQVNPAGNPTVFTNNNSFFPFVGADPKQDSQFLVNSNDVVVPPGLAEEGPAILQAAWAWSTPQAATAGLPIAQIVIPTAGTATVAYRGQFTVFQNGANVDLGIETGTLGGDPPALPVITLRDLGERSNIVISEALSAAPGPVTWSGLTPGSGSPAIPATLSSDGQFQWVTTGSARGPLGNGTLYSWNATATNTAGATSGLAIQLRLVIPEPASMTLIGLAMVGLVSFGFRKRS